jgi:hypothetical protein
MKTDKSRIDPEAELVYDESLRGVDIDDLHGRSGLRFKDDGIAEVPKGPKVYVIPVSKPYRERYEDIAWECEDCGEMHPKGEECV